MGLSQAPLASLPCSSQLPSPTPGLNENPSSACRAHGHPPSLLPCWDVTARLCFSSKTRGACSRDSAARSQRTAPCTARPACSTRRRHLSHHLSFPPGASLSLKNFIAPLSCFTSPHIQREAQDGSQQRPNAQNQQKNHSTCRM